MQIRTLQDLSNSLYELLVHENDPQAQRGALRAEMTLTTGQRQVLNSIPPNAATRTSALEIHKAIAEAYLPRARALLAAVDGAYPSAFEKGTLEALKQKLGLSINHLQPLRRAE